MWLDIAKAFCLVLVIEGIIPFIAPTRWRNLVLMMAQIDDRSMRTTGFTSMIIGAGVLFFLR